MKVPTILCVLALTLLLAACRPIAMPAASPEASGSGTSLAGQPPVILEPEGFTQRIHDPVMAKDGDTYYVFSTGSRIMIICSRDMVTWEFCGRVFARVPSWIMQAVPGVSDLWAPDISFFSGKWHLYYAASTFGSPRSVIALATNATLDPANPDYAWVDEGPVIESTGAENWNAIDPNVVLDDAGEPWLAFGSYWSGLKLIKLDAASGKRSSADATLYSIAQRPANAPGGTAIEAPFIVKHGDFYYLFASFDACCRGRDSTYNVRVGRSAEITGPYIDREGVSMLDGGGTRILDAYDQWRGPGHNGFYRKAGVDWFPYHAYNAQLNGISFLRLESLGWDEAGWPYLASQGGE